MNYMIREIKQEELPILKDMLYEAIFQPDESNLLPKEIIKEPKIAVYIADWGKPDDICYVAEVDKKIVGAVWTRILNGEIKGYGNIDDETPEFAISLFKEYRNKGIGKALMKTMISRLKQEGYQKTSLSVDKNNYAVKLYFKVGFEVIAEHQDGYLMVLNLT